MNGRSVICIQGCSGEGFNTPPKGFKRSSKCWKKHWCRSATTMTKILHILSYPVNHQKVIWDKNDDSFSGQGFWWGRKKEYFFNNFHFQKYNVDNITRLQNLYKIRLWQKVMGGLVLDLRATLLSHGNIICSIIKFCF